MTVTWVAYKLSDTAGIHDVSRVIGPFDNRVDAEACCIDKLLDGVIAIEPLKSAMAHVYEGDPDGRQATGDIETSRFRPRYRKLTEAEKILHDEIKAKAEELERLYNHVKSGRYRALAITELEASVMWVIKELTS